MAFCRKCGSEIDDEAVICPKCGVAQQKINNESNNVIGSTRNTNAISVLGIILPPVGWIIYAIMDKSKPLAKDLLSGNIVGSIFYIAIILIIVIYPRISG